MALVQLRIMAHNGSGPIAHNGALAAVKLMPYNHPIQMNTPEQVSV